MSSFVDNVVKSCREQYKRFDNGKGQETLDPYAFYVGEYWRVGLNRKGIDGRTTFENQRGELYRPAWSSAFISYIARKSGAGKSFFYSEAHIHYVVKSLRDAKEKPPVAKFLGRDPTTYVPKVGDLINAGRESAADVTYKTVLRRYGPKPAGEGKFMATHSDFVVEIDSQKRQLQSIGGNVQKDTVGLKTWKLKADGTLAKGATLICVIECLL